MPTKPLERLIFAQGGACFFCRKQLPKADASVEHLVALTHGGKDNDENCVACCKALNSLFGRMSLKEKLQIVLNQEGAFVCPAGVATTPKAPATLKPAAKASWTKEERFDLVIADLHKRGNARPGTEEKLLNTIKSCLAHIGESENEAVVLLGELRTRNYVTVEGKKIKYELPQKAV